MQKDIFDYKDYKSYLLAKIASKPSGGRGVRMALSKSVGCPVSYVSQVLGGGAHFSMEQAEAINEFLAHTDEESDFFLLQLQYARAGTQGLKKRFKRQMALSLQKRLDLSDRLGIKTGLSIEDQMIFYSTWLYGAIHVMVSISKFQTREAISQHLGVSLRRISEMLEFLVSTGLIIKKDNGHFTIGKARIHLGADSPLISNFHTNWRMRAVQSLEIDKLKDDLHYSSAVTLSDSDSLKIKSILVKNIEEIKLIIRESKEEGVHCFSLDFFRI